MSESLSEKHREQNLHKDALVASLRSKCRRARAIIMEINDELTKAREVNKEIDVDIYLDRAFGAVWEVYKALKA